jgi:hypothetical protein
VAGAALASGYRSAAFTGDAEQTVAFFRSIDDAFGTVSSVHALTAGVNGEGVPRRRASI